MGFNISTSHAANGATGVSNMAGGSGSRLGRSVAAVERCGSSRDTILTPDHIPFVYKESSETSKT